jgi:hypothetical protein
MSTNTDSFQPDLERKARLFLEHPSGCPKIIGTLPYLIDPPGSWSTTDSWIRFRDKTLLPMMRHDPDDPNLPNFIRQVERILAWRATVPVEDRFWKE